MLKREHWMKAGMIVMFACCFFTFAGTACGGEKIKTSYFTDAETDSPDLLLYIPFDGTANPCKGDAVPKRIDGKVPMEVDLGEGIFGQALLCGEDTVCYTHSLSDWSQGTIEMWVKLNFDPAKPVVDKSRYHELISIPSKDGESFRLFIRQNLKWKSTCMNFATLRDGEWTYAPWFNIHWEKDEWHHVAISWDRKQKYLFVDGKQAYEKAYGKEVKLKTPFIMGKRIIVGGVSGKGYLGSRMFNGSIDELLVWKKTLKIQNREMNF